jgi:hypothetical protein
MWLRGVAASDTIPIRRVLELTTGPTIDRCYRCVEHVRTRSHGPETIG